MSDGLFSISEGCSCKRWYCRVCNPDPLEQAMEASLSLAGDWKMKADAWLKQQPQMFRFTSEDVTDAIGYPSGENAMHRNNAVGAWMRGCRKKNLIERLEPVTSRHSRSHGATIWLWMKK